MRLPDQQSATSTGEFEPGLRFGILTTPLFLIVLPLLVPVAHWLMMIKPRSGRMHLQSEAWLTVVAVASFAVLAAGCDEPKGAPNSEYNRTYQFQVTRENLINAIEDLGYEIRPAEPQSPGGLVNGVSFSRPVKIEVPQDVCEYGDSYQSATVSVRDAELGSELVLTAIAPNCYVRPSGNAELPPPETFLRIFETKVIDRLRETTAAAQTGAP